MKILLASDGSACADRAVQYLVGSLRTQAKSLDVTLFHVCAPMLDRVAAALGEERVAEIRREDSAEALQGARKRLKRAGTTFDEAHTAGNAAYCISQRHREENTTWC